MILQSVILPRRDICPVEEMYFRRPYGDAKLLGDRITLGFGDKIGFDTYFGSFCSDRWLRYTVVDSISLGIRAAGKARCTVLRRWVENGEFCDEEVFEETVVFDGGTSWFSPDIALAPASVYSFTLTPAEEGFSFFGAAYCTDRKAVNEVSIALGITTYKREAALRRTMNMLTEQVFRQGSMLNGRLRVIISDNGGTLGEGVSRDGNVRIVANRNLGGAGGFTRTMLEAVKDKGFTHVLLADDDARLDPMSLERTFVFLSLLREEHRDLTVGGALLREDIPWLQYEAGACWNGGPMEIHGHGLDLRRVADVITNGADTRPIDYAGWWYCCIPILRMKQIGLPLPLFIHRDDVEYGLRCGKVTTLPGVCVWHEAFELKMSGTSEYYDVRNTAIVNAVHEYKDGAAVLTKYLNKRVLINLLTCRYRYVHMNLDAIKDFLKGFDFLRTTDGVELHRSLMEQDYKLCDVESLPSFRSVRNFEKEFADQKEACVSAGSGNLLEGIKDKSMDVLSVAGLGGILPDKKNTVLAVNPSPVRRCFRAGRIIHCTVDRRGYEVARDKSEQKKCVEEYRQVAALIKENYSRVAAEYKARSGEVRTAGYWRGILGIEQ